MHPNRKKIDHEAQLPKGVVFNGEAIWNSVQLPQKKKPKAWIWVAAASVTVLLVGWWLTQDNSPSSLDTVIAAKNLPEAIINSTQSEKLSFEEPKQENQLTEIVKSPIIIQNTAPKVLTKDDSPEEKQKSIENPSLTTAAKKDTVSQELQEHQLVAETASAKTSNLSIEEVALESLSPAARRLQANLQAQQKDLPVKEIEISEPFRIQDIWTTKPYVTTNQRTRNESFFTTLTTKTHEKN
ncbi:hypothetical protein [Mongoliitalea daihaiensis]|uniref:hypothetical protein n=1 Tax=Mongoliitalea daihaiensis TaxID=2782006 RepID=UPI001F2EA45F|nr:hypothetical protein [Mongoliitalea daihaiensis]UJP66504.1 hypothetical protein IPZ59_07870 [Mongoliitalea daihaiensis]